MGSVTHHAKAGSLLTGAEYEADAHVIALDAADIPSHNHSGADITSGTVADARVDAALARDAEVTSAVSTHAAVTTSVHGIADTSLLAKIYVQAGDPGAVGAGALWLDTSGNLSIRNSANGAWIAVLSGS